MTAETADNGKFFELLAVQVAGGATVKAASESCGCSERQAYRLSSTPEFRSRVAEIRSEMTSSAVGILTEACTKAAQTLADMLSGDQEPKDRLAAARLILANMGPLAEHSELRARLDKLEQNR